MTTHPLTLRPWQITALQQHRLRMVVLPLRPQPHPDLPIGGAEFVKMEDDGPGSWCWLNGFDGSIISKFSVPFSPGDTLWVRETWALVPASAYRMSDGIQQSVNPTDMDRAAIYRAGFDRSRGGIRWRSPVTMPRWASRFTLTVTDVRVERVQDISEDDAFAEGVSRSDVPLAMWRSVFRTLWNRTHGPDAWDRNDWVAVPTLTVARANIGDDR